MKVAIFTDTFSPQINGVTKTLDKQLSFFNKYNIDYVVFAPGFPRKNISLVGENIQRMLSLKFFLYPECRISIPNYHAIKIKLKEFKPDLIHLVTEFNLGLTGLHYAKKSNTPVISSYHTNFSEYLNYYKLTMLEKPLWSYLRWFHNQCLINFCPSLSTLMELRKRGFQRLELWKRGIDPDLFSPKFRDENLRIRMGINNKISFLYVGRLAPEKNLELLLKSFKILNNKYKEKISLIITGEGPLFKKIKKDSPSNVIFTGYKTGEELTKIYASSDIFAFPSLTETYGNVILEAMAAGLPVVAVPAGGVKENLKDGFNGLACKENNPHKFAEKLEQLIINNELRKVLGFNARKHALEQSWDETMKKLLENYHEAICYHNMIKESA